MKTTRYVVTVLVTLLLLAAACGPGTEATPTPVEEAEEETGPILVGLLAPTSSVAAESAQDMIDAWNLYWEQQGTTVAGREIQTFVEDSAGDPDTALNKARLLVEQRDVDMLVGTLFASEGYSVATLTEETGVPTFYPIAASDNLTQREPVDAMIRVAGWTSSQVHHPFGEWVVENTDCRRVYTIGADYAFGHEVVGGFVNTFTDHGGEVADQAWNPIGESDFSSYLATLQSAEPDCVFNLQVGATAVRFIQAWNDFGLKDSDIDLYQGEVPGDASILRGIDPPELAEGLMSVGHYAEGRDSRATQDFVEAYDERYGKLPSYYSVALYTAAQWIARAIEEVDGNVEDQEAFLEAVRNVEFADTPMGPLQLDEYDNPVMNIYVREVEIREDGRAWNRVVDTIPSVSQFYKYAPDAFLDQPVYSRDYQGADWPTSCDSYAADCPF